MSHFQPPSADIRPKFRHPLESSNEGRLQLIQQIKERRAARKTTPIAVSAPMIPDKKILERIGIILNAERFMHEIIADYRKRKESITIKNIEELFSENPPKSDLDHAKSILHFKSCYLQSRQALEKIDGIGEETQSLHHHINGYMQMKLALLGIDPKFKEQYENGNWELYSFATPILPPEAFLRAELVNTIDLDTCNLIKLPPEIQLWKNVTYLNLHNTFIKALPKEIGELKNLDYLNIANCTYLKTLPHEIIKLQNLSIFIFVSMDEEEENHDVSVCYSQHQCTDGICTILFQDLTLAQQKWLRHLKLKSCVIEGLHIGKIKT